MQFQVEALKRETINIDEINRLEIDFHNSKLESSFGLITNSCRFVCAESYWNIIAVRSKQ